MKHPWALVVLGVAALLASPLAAQNAAPLRSRTPALARAAPPAARLLFARSATSSGPLAWVLFLSGTPRAGRLYDPLGLLELCGLQAGAGGAFGFRAEGADGERYDFAGRERAGRIAGELRTRPETGAADTARVEFEDVALAGLDPRSGVYGNVEEGEEGDLGGTEVVLFVRGDSAWGAVTVFEGGPAGPYPVAGHFQAGRLSLRMPVSPSDTIGVAMDLGAPEAVLRWETGDPPERLTRTSLGAFFRGGRILTHCPKR